MVKKHATRQEMEERIQLVMDLRARNLHVRPYVLQTIIMTEFGLKRRQAAEILREAEDRLAADNPRAVRNLQHHFPYLWGEAWVRAVERADGRAQAALLRTLATMPAQQDDGTTDVDPDAVTFEIVQQGDQGPNRAVPADDHH